MRELFSKRGIYYRINDFGNRKQTIVFIHGLSGSSSAWLEYEKKFTADYNLVAPDLRGHGKSKKFKNYGDYKIDNFVDDIEEILQELKVGKFILVSHSFGAIIALALIKRRKEDITKAVFLAPVFNASKIKWVWIVRLLISWSIPFIGFFKFKPFPGRHINYSKYTPARDWDFRRITTDIANTTLRAYLFSSRQTYGFDGEKYLREISMPALIIHGKKDTIVPAEKSLEAAKQIKSCKIILLENANHILILNNQAEVAGIIGDFLK